MKLRLGRARRLAAERRRAWRRAWKLRLISFIYWIFGELALARWAWKEAAELLAETPCQTKQAAPRTTNARRRRQILARRQRRKASLRVPT
jgi:hypothetical protein